MQRVITGGIVGLALTVIGASAQTGLTGRWQGETPNGTPLVLELTATDSELTGTLTRADETVKIADGKVAKNTFTFKATLNEQTEGFTGEFTGDQMKVWLDRQGPERTATLKRAPSEKK